MITIERLTKRYDDDIVVDDVSLGIAEGAIVAVVGASGSGKTTLLRMINRMVEPTSGRVLIAGEDTRATARHLLRRSIGYAIQGHGLFPHRTIAENVATTPRLLGWDKARIEARVDELLSLFGLEPAIYGHRYPHQLYGCQQQRVGVARALAAFPRVLLMDEPFGALDPIVRAKAQADLRAIQRKLGVTVMLVTHDMDEATGLADRIAIMEGGRLVQEATPVEVLTHPATQFAADMFGADERPFRLLSLKSVADLTQPGEAGGGPIAADADCREALAALLWSARTAAPVTGAGGERLGIVTLARLVEAAAAKAR
ncbi:MAG TPA: ABC transporter ATP-binding protein [Hansschlegelia sp.]